MPSLRRHVSFVFLCTDTAHLTARHVDVDALAREVASHEQRVLATVTRRGGRPWSRSDGSGGVFGSIPDAVRAAIEIIGPGSVGEGPGIAIDTGEAVEHEGRWVGPAPLRAGRLSVIAGPGVVVVSESVARVLDVHPVAGVRLRPLGPWEMPGMGTVDVHALELGADVDGLSADDDVSLAGSARPGDALHRTTEAQVVLDALNAPADTAQGLVLVGEAGIGKTAIWRDGVANARRLGMRVLAAAAEGPDQELAFGLLRELLADVTEAELDLLPSLQRDALSAVLLRRRGDAPAPRELVASAVHTLLTRMARMRPVLVAVDDLPWADDDSARVLGLALRRTSGSRVVLLATERLGPGDTAIDWAGLFAPLHCRRHVVGPMGSAELAEVLRVRLDDPRSLRALERIAEEADGNALLALELARTGGPDGGEGPTLDRVRRRVAERVETLPPDSAGLLAVLAVAPGSHLDDVVAAVPEIEVGRAVAAAERAGLLAVDGARLRFVHPVQRHAVLTTLAESDRRELHRRLVDVVADPVERAVHLAQATLVPDEAVAATLSDAVVLASGRGAVAAAAALADRAVELTPAASRSATVGRMLLAAGEHWQDGDRPRCLALLDDAASLAATPDDRARVLVARSRLWDASFPPDADLMAALTWPDLAPGTRASLHLAATFLHLLVMQNQAAAATGAAGLAIAEQHGTDPIVRRYLAGATGFATVFVGDDAGWRLMEEAAVQSGSDAVVMPDLQNDPRTFLAMARFHHDDLDGARQLLRQLAEEADMLGKDAALSIFRLMLAQVAVRMGDVATARGHLGLRRPSSSEADERAVPTADADAPTDLMDLGDAFARAFVAVATGDEVQAARAAEAAAGFPPVMSAWGLVALAAPGQIALARMDARAADEVLAPLPAVEDTVTDSPLVAMVHRIRGDAAEAAVLVGDLDRAEGLVADLERLATTAGGRWAPVAASRARAALALARGDDDMVELADRAVRRAADHPDPYEVARSRLVAGVAHRAAGSRQAARDLLSAAQESFARLGNVAWQERATAELGRISGRRPHDAGALTPTQESIADLAADGLTNREIAARLYLSPKTVENNLTAIYRALGVRSRTELAASR